MKRYHFEIVRRECGRFGWEFVRIDDQGRRVLAHSERSYGSKKRVRRAIAAVRGARLVDTTTTVRVPFPLPVTSFALVPGVVPLIVAAGAAEYDPEQYRPRAATIEAQAPAEQAPAEQAPAEQAPAEQAPAEQAPAEQAPAEQAPAEQAPAEQASAEEPEAEKPTGPRRGRTS
jgi:hypothetical protein